MRLTLTIPEAAELLGVSRGTAYEAARTGQLPTLRLGRRLLVPRHQLEALIGPENGEGPAETPDLRETQTKEKSNDEREQHRGET